MCVPCCCYSCVCILRGRGERERFKLIWLEIFWFLFFFVSFSPSINYFWWWWRASVAVLMVLSTTKSASFPTTLPPSLTTTWPFPFFFLYKDISAQLYSEGMLLLLIILCLYGLKKSAVLQGVMFQLTTVILYFFVLPRILPYIYQELLLDLSNIEGTHNRYIHYSLYLLWWGRGGVFRNTIGNPTISLLHI